MDLTKNLKILIGGVVLLVICVFATIFCLVYFGDEIFGASNSTESNSTSPQSTSKERGSGGTNAGSTGSGKFEVYQIDALKQHNDYRAKHRSPRLVLDAQLNDIAVRCAEHYANIKTIDHSCPFKKLNGEPVGENLFMSSVSGGGTFGSDSELALKAGELWYDEINLYNFDRPGFALETGHFTCLVWKSSTKFGIAVLTRGNNAYSAAMYLEHPNVQGEFETNVLKPSR